MLLLRVEGMPLVDPLFHTADCGFIAIFAPMCYGRDDGQRRRDLLIPCKNRWKDEAICRSSPLLRRQPPVPEHTHCFAGAFDIAQAEGCGREASCALGRLSGPAG